MMNRFVKFTRVHGTYECTDEPHSVCINPEYVKAVKSLPNGMSAIILLTGPIIYTHDSLDSITYSLENLTSIRG